MEKIMSCPFCGKEMSNYAIYSCGGTPTLFHTCINGVEIKVQGKTNHDVIRNWNAFIATMYK